MKVRKLIDSTSVDFSEGAVNGEHILDTIEMDDAVRALDRAAHRDSFKILLEP